MKEVKPFYKSKVLIFNVISIVVMVAGYFGFSEFTPNAEYLDTATKVMAAILPLANIALRFFTDKGVVMQSTAKK